MPQPLIVRDDDDLGPLPPLDGDDRGTPEPEGDFGQLLEEDRSEASLDDATSEDEAVDAAELPEGEEEAGWLDEPTDTPDLDLGDFAIADFVSDDAVLDDAEEGKGEGEDFGFGEGPERDALDAGDEGPLAEDEDLLEDELPPLDADEEGCGDDSALPFVERFASEDPLGLPWAPEPWSRVGAPIAIAAATAVACQGRGALVAGRWEGGQAELLRVDLEGTWQGIGAGGIEAAAARGLSAEGETVAAVVEGGRVLLSRDGGASFAAVRVAAGANGAEPSALEAVLSSGVLWVLSADGGLLAGSVCGDGMLERVAAPGAVAALVRRAPDGIATFLVDASGQPRGIERRATAAPPERPYVPVSEGLSTCGGAPVLAARGRHLAYAVRGGGVARFLDGGAWSSVSWEGQVTALAFVDDAGALVAATYSEADDTTALVLLEPSGRPMVTARLGAARADGDVDGKVRAMAYDDSRGVVWVAGGQGVAAFSVRSGVGPVGSSAPADGADFSESSDSKRPVI